MVVEVAMATMATAKLSVGTLAALSVDGCARETETPARARLNGASNCRPFYGVVSG